MLRLGHGARRLIEEEGGDCHDREVEEDGAGAGDRAEAFLERGIAVEDLCGECGGELSLRALDRFMSLAAAGGKLRQRFDPFERGTKVACVAGQPF